MHTNIRQTPPSVKEVEKIFPEKIHTETLEQDVSFKFIFDDRFPTVRIAFKFPAGSWYESQKLLAVNAARLAKAGTTNKTAALLAKEIDITGGKIIFSCFEDHAWVNISCLSEKLKAVLELTSEIICHAHFPEEEINLHKKQLLQKLKLNNSKTDYVAQKHFFASVFGPDHPYGYFSTEEAIKALNHESLLSFFKTHYTTHELEIVGVGNFDEKNRAMLNRFIRNLKKAENNTVISKHVIQPDEVKRKVFPVKKAEQASVVMGTKALQRNDKDYIDYSIMITLFGGYFGSRLMTNLREEKGLTYGVYAQIINYKYESCLLIQADVNKSAAQQVVDEIHFEIEKLKREEVKAAELSNLKHYLSGNLLGILDGKQKQYQMLKQIVSYDLSHDFLYDYFYGVKNISPETIQSMAKKYLDKKAFYEIIAGVKE